nr:reverse transcriptase domain-containing protein [Tanacetum cinerariifolium]
MLKSGKLSHLIKELRQSSGKDQVKVANKSETSGKKKPLAILMVQPWQRVAKQKITQTLSLGSVISFSPLREEDGMEGPMIIEAEIGRQFVHRMYVDRGSSSEILYEHCFNRFCLEVRSQMILATTPLVGFSVEIIWPLRKISLLVKTDNEEHSTSAWMNFMIVRLPSPYNGIIGRPRVRRIQAVPSTTHGMLEFPMVGGTVMLWSSGIILLECTMILGLGVHAFISSVSYFPMKFTEFASISFFYQGCNCGGGLKFTLSKAMISFGVFMRRVNLSCFRYGICWFRNPPFLKFCFCPASCCFHDGNNLFCSRLEAATSFLRNVVVTFIISSTNFGIYNAVV